MANKDVLSLAIGIVKGNVEGNYTVAQAEDTLRSALVEMNGGSTKLNVKTFHRGNELFELVEELIPTIIEKGLTENNPIFKLVEYKNIKDGDLNEFTTNGECTLVVADAADGIQGVRRQRLSNGESISVKTSTKIVRVYEELSRVLSGRVDFNDFINKVAEAFNKQILADAYAAIASISAETKGLNSTYVKTGSYSEDTLIELIDHVEAATGKKATVYGTKAALRKITTATVSDEAKRDLYNIGHYGKIAGTDMVCLAQAHKADGTTFALDNTKIFVIASDDQPIKMVNEGEGVMAEKQATDNNDLTSEYLYIQRFGVGVICAGKLGVYTINA